MQLQWLVSWHDLLDLERVVPVLGLRHGGWEGGPHEENTERGTSGGAHATRQHLVQGGKAGLSLWSGDHKFLLNMGTSANSVPEVL